MCAVIKSDLLLEGISEDSLDISIDPDELLRLLWQLLLHLSGVDKELLQEGPVPLNLTAEKYDFRNSGQSLLPLDAPIFEGGKVARGKHTVDLSLVFFKLLEVFFAKLEHLDTRALVRLELKFNVFPEDLSVVKSLLHLGLLDSLICDLLNIVSNLAKLELVDIAEEKFLVNDEVDTALLTDHVPMALTHGFVSKLTTKRQELKPLLDLLKDSSVRVALLVDLHALESSLELLDLFFHVISLGLLPSVVHVAVEDALAGGDVGPEALHEADLILDLTNLDLGSLDSLWVLELLCVVLELLRLLNEGVDLIVDVLKAL